jgi:hypothetical protein
MELNKLQAHLLKVKQSDWKLLAELLKEIEATEEFSTRTGLQQKNKNTFVLPAVVPAEVVFKFKRLVERMDLVPEYDWTEWKDAQLILENRENEMEGLDATALCKLFTVMIKADEFASGFLVSCFSNGAVALILKKLISEYWKEE